MTIMVIPFMVNLIMVTREDFEYSRVLNYRYKHKTKVDAIEGSGMSISNLRPS